MPKVSVIVPAYRCEATLEEAVRSVFGQTLSDWELVICDDCSPDGTHALASRLAQGRDDVRVLKTRSNAGAGAARNLCIEAASGEYIALLDSDDICCPERLELQARFLDAHPEYAMVGAHAEIFDDRGPYGSLRPPEKPLAIDFRRGAPFAHATLMLRREVFVKAGLYKTREEVSRSEDFEFLVRVYAAGLLGYNLQHILYRYRVGPDDYRKRKFRHRLHSVSLRRKAFKTLGLPAGSYIHIIRPLVMAFVPSFLQRKIAQRRFR